MMETNTWNLWIATSLDEGCDRKRRTEAAFGICGNIVLTDFKEEGLIIPDPITTHSSPSHAFSSVFKENYKHDWMGWNETSQNRLSEMGSCPKEQRVEKELPVWAICVAVWTLNVFFFLNHAFSNNQNK